MIDTHITTPTIKKKNMTRPIIFVTTDDHTSLIGMRTHYKTCMINLDYIWDILLFHTKKGLSYSVFFGDETDCVLDVCGLTRWTTFFCYLIVTQVM